MMRRFSSALSRTVKATAVATTTSVRFQNSWRPAHVPVSDDPMSYLDYGHPDDPLHYQLLALRPGTRLYEVKLRFLLQCRRHHPAVGGDAERFLRINLAYQDVLKDYGLETIKGEICNLGNFQVDPSIARDYLQIRASINEHIPYSTLLDHIKEIEVVEQKLIDVKRDLLSHGKIDDGHLLDGEYAKLEEDSLFPPTARIAASSSSATSAESAAASIGEAAFQDETAAAASSTPEADAVKSEFSDVSAQSHAGADATIPATEGADASATDNTLQNVDETAQDLAAAHQNEIKGIDVDDIVDRNGKLDEDLLAMRVLSKEELAVYERKYDVEFRNDIAGEAARTATVMMNNVGEVKQIKHWSLAVVGTWLTLFTMIWGGYEALARRKGVGKSQAGSITEKEIDGEMALPWWGNDTEYERQVKRIYVEEWMKARRTARRVQTYQDGVQREVKTDAERADEDVDIFKVSPERLEKMRDHAVAQNGKY